MKIFENTVIVTDLDGTLLTSDGKLGDRNLRAIEYFKANGGRFAVATGRVAALAKDAIPELSALVNMPSVTCNGACMYDFRTDEAPVVHTMELELVKDMADFVHENYPSAGVRASAVEYAYVTVPEDENNFYIQRDYDRHPDVKKLVAPIDEWKGLTLFKLVVRLPAEELEKGYVIDKEMKIPQDVNGICAELETDIGKLFVNITGKPSCDSLENSFNLSYGKISLSEIIRAP